MNKSHQSNEEEYLSVLNREQYYHQDNGFEKYEGAMHNDANTDAQYTVDTI